MIFLFFFGLDSLASGIVKKNDHPTNKIHRVIFEASNAKKNKHIAAKTRLPPDLTLPKWLEDEIIVHGKDGVRKADGVNATDGVN